MSFASRKFLGLLAAATAVILGEYALVLSDCVIAGRVLGETALGAVNLLAPVFAAASFLTWCLAEGTATLYADAVARTRPGHAANLAGQGLAASALLGLALLAATTALRRPYLAFLSPDPATDSLVSAYWAWYPLAAALEAVDLTLLYLVYTDGGTRSCAAAYALQVAANLALSWGLCSGSLGLPRLGMAGISLGTALSYPVGALALLPRLLDRRACGLRFAPRLLPRDLARSFAAGFGDASSGLFQALAFLVATKCLLGRWGSGALPAAAVVFCVLRLAVFFNGVGIALQPLQTVYHGEGNAGAVRRLLGTAALAALAEGALLAVLVAAVPRAVAALAGVADPGVAAAAAKGVRIVALGLPGYALAYLLNSHWQYVGRPGRSAAVTAFAFFLIPSALLLLAFFSNGIESVWMALAAGPTLAVAAFLPDLARGPRGAAAAPAPVTGPLAAPGDPARLAGEARPVLLHAFAPADALRLARALGPALERIRAANAGRRRLLAEVSAIRSPDGPRVVVRDDGRAFAVDGIGLPVRHRPASGFNRNVLLLPPPEPPAFADRYEVLHGCEAALPEIADLVALDEKSFGARFRMTAEENAALFRVNPENGIVVRDRASGRLVGYAMLLPLPEETYELFRLGRYDETTLCPASVLPYDAPGLYDVYFSSIAVHPDHRCAAMLLALFDAMVRDFLALSRRGIFIRRMVADVVSPEGERFCRLFGLRKIRESGHGSSVCEVEAFPPRFCAITPVARRLLEAYRRAAASPAPPRASGWGRELPAADAGQGRRHG